MQRELRNKLLEVSPAHQPILEPEVQRLDETLYVCHLTLSWPPLKIIRADALHFLSGRVQWVVVIT